MKSILANFALLLFIIQATSVLADSKGHRHQHRRRQLRASHQDQRQLVDKLYEIYNGMYDEKHRQLQKPDDEEEENNRDEEDEHEDEEEEHEDEEHEDEEDFEDFEDFEDEEIALTLTTDQLSTLINFAISLFNVLWTYFTGTSPTK